MRIEIPVTLYVKFYLRPEDIRNPNIGQLIGQEFMNLIDGILPKFLQNITFYRNGVTTITEPMLDKFSIKSDTKAIELRIPLLSPENTLEAYECEGITTIKIIYNDDNQPNDDVMKKSIINLTYMTIQGLNGPYQWNPLPFSSRSNPIFQGDSIFDFGKTNPEFLKQNIKHRETELILLTGFPKMPKNIAGSIANFVGKKLPPIHWARTRPLPKVLTNEGIEAAAERVAGAALASAAAEAAPVPVPAEKNPWWKFWKKGGKRKTMRKRKNSHKKRRATYAKRG
jgi:hypothetical protein